MTTEAVSNEEIVAKAGKYYRNTRYLMAAMFVVMGFWFAYDGFYNWPRLKAEAEAKQARGEKTEKPKTNTDILIQKMLGVSLPPLGIALLAWTLYNSRGAYRLSGSTLHVPGHPPVPLENISAVDKTQWDRKGIAYLTYDLGAGRGQGRIKLDDFVYERPPTDAIVDKIEATMIAPVDATASA